jgi:Putative metallopeptidase domain
MESLKQLKRALLRERVLLEDGDTPPKIIQELLFKISYVNPFISNLLGSTHTDWYEDTSIDTAGVTVKFGKIHFFYNPEFIESLSEPELVFLLMHEIYHIFKQHTIRGKMTGGDPEKHTLFNIAADAIINDEVEKDGGPGGRPLKVIPHAWFIKPHGAAGEYGSVEKEFQKDPKDLYNGKDLTEELYKWMLDRKGNWQPPKPSPGNPPPAPPWHPKVGEIIYNDKTGEYGKIATISGKKYTVETMTEQEVEKVFGIPVGSTGGTAAPGSVQNVGDVQVSHLEREMLKRQARKK